MDKKTKKKQKGTVKEALRIQSEWLYLSEREGILRCFYEYLRESGREAQLWEEAGVLELSLAEDSSMDMEVLEKDQWDKKILATDISTKVLQQAMLGIYSEEQLKNLPEQWKRHFFKPAAGGSQYQVTDELKREVIFRQFNLMEPLPFKKKLHTVFLRNVMIYFDDNTKRDLVQRVYDAMEPGGYFFIGTTETIDRNSTPFQIIQPSIFRKREG